MDTPERAAAGTTTSLAAATVIDLGLILAVDCSSSVTVADFRIQMDGIAAALRNPLVIEAIRSGGRSQIALALVHWSNSVTQFVAMPWRLLGSAAQLESAAQAIESTERHWRAGGTGLAAAIDYCAGQLAALPWPADRQVIDVSGDGWDNVGGSAAASRDRAVIAGIKINGLPITNGSKLLVTYYRDQVIGGQGSFLMPVENIWSFHDAILRKLLREIAPAVS